MGKTIPCIMCTKTRVHIVHRSASCVANTVTLEVAYHHLCHVIICHTNQPCLNVGECEYLGEKRDHWGLSEMILTTVIFTVSVLFIR